MADSSTGGPEGVSRETPGEVPRETISAPDPVVAAEVFAPSRVRLLERYAALLATEGVVRGLIGPREVPRLWDRHLINCGLVAPWIPEKVTVADLGSGAGLPGLVLAIARPDLEVTLVEPMARRVAFLERARTELSLDNVEVVRTRAEQWRGSPQFDVVTARALAPLSRLLAWGLPLVSADGCLLAMKGSSAATEILEAGADLARRGAVAEVLTSSVPGSSVTTVVRVVRDPSTGIGWAPSSSRRRRRERT
jgi:16S rRNA (guanine527-N7)-methyltransferase